MSATATAQIRDDPRYVELWRLAKDYEGASGPVNVVEEFSLLVPRGQFVCIIGHSGCGKSTVLSMIAGLSSISRGAVVIDSEQIEGAGPDRGMVFQSPCLLPWMTALENVSLGVGQVRPEASSSERIAIARRYLAMVGLGDDMQKRPAQLSQGMRQRVGIARAFALSPKVLLLDEPFGMLDCITRMELQNTLIELWSRERQTALMVTHDVDEAILLADRVVMMTNGPHAHVGEVIDIPFARPRIRETLMETPEYYALRERLIEFLENQGHAKSDPRGDDGNAAEIAARLANGQLDDDVDVAEDDDVSDDAPQAAAMIATRSRERTQGEFYIDPKAALTGVVAVGLLASAIFFGSAGMSNFDSALTHYAVSSLVALFAVVYRLTIWMSRPPTRRLFRRAAINLLQRRPATHSSMLAALSQRLMNAFVAQKFIRKRGLLRWGAHAGLSYGSLLGFALTFPLVFGWIHFESPADGRIYQLRVFGSALDQFSVDSFKALIAFNLLNVAAVMVLIGAALASWRRLRDHGERATQTFGEDWMPILLLTAVSATGLMMTASTRLAAGQGYALVATAHALTVIALLLYIPFGKLLHMFQRIAALALAVNRRAEMGVAPAFCFSCEAPFASVAQVEDLHAILTESKLLPIFKRRDSELPYTQVCPSCRRRLLAVNQGRALGR